MKKVLSILLAASMLIAMLPNIAFAAELKGEDYNFNSQALYGVGYTGTLQCKNYTNFGEYYEGFDTAASSSKWAYVGQSGLNGANISKDASNFSMKPAVLQSTIAAGAGFVLKIDIGNSGIYTPTFTFKTRILANGMAGVQADVYLVDCEYEGYSDYTAFGEGTADVKSMILNAPVSAKIGSVDTDTQTNNGTVITLDDVSVEKGEYYLVFHITGYNQTTWETQQNWATNNNGDTNSSNWGIMLMKLVLAEKPASALDVSPSNISVKTGNSAKITASVTDSANAVIPSAKVTYKSARESVAKVDADGVVTGVAAGNTTITVSVVGYPDLTKEIPVMVEATDVISNYKYSFWYQALDLPAPISVANMITADAGLKGEYSSSYVDSDRWTLIGTRANYGGAISGAKEHQKYTNVALKTATTLSGESGSGIVFKIEVLQSGIYTPALQYVTNDLGLKTKIWIVDTDLSAGENPKFTGLGAVSTSNAWIDTFIHNTDAEKYCIGTVDTYTNANEANPKVLKQVYLEAGDYYLVFGMNDVNEALAETSAKFTVLLKQFTLSENPAKSIEISKTSITLDAGKTETISSTVKNEKGEILSEAEVEYTSSNSEIVSVDSNGVIKAGTEAGNATITAKVKGYNKVSKTISVTVNEAPKAVSAKYVFKAKSLNPSATDVVRFAQYVNPNTYYDTFDTNASARWAVVGTRAFNVAYIGVDNAAMFNLPKESMDNALSVNLGAGFRIEVPETGEYSADMTCYTRKSLPGMQANVYLVRADTGAYAKFDLTNGIVNALSRLNDNQLVGSIDTDVNENSNAYPIALDRNVKLEKGDYYLFFKPTGYDKKHLEDSSVENLSINIVDFTLTKTGDYTPNTIEYDPNVSFAADANVEAVAIATSVSGYNQGSVADIEIGKEITVTAPAVDGYIFRGWVRGTASGNVTNYVSEENEFTLKLVTNTYLTAVYDEIKEVTETDKKVVEFWSEDGKYCTEIAVGADGKLASLPSAPQLIGKTFDKWYISETEELTTDTVLTEAITRSVARYTAKPITGIKFVDKTLDTLSYGDEVYLNALEGKATYWMRDGKVIDFSSDYTYYAWDETDITYGTTQVFWEPLVILDNYANGAFMIEYDAESSGYQVVEVGILLNDTPNFNVNSCGAKVTSQRKGSHGQFSVAVDEGTYARGYMIYKEAGKYRIIYTDNVEKAE